MLPLLLAISIFGIPDAKASQDALNNALKNKDYAGATHLLQTAEPGHYRAHLIEAARHNLGPAQWMLAGDYWRSGDTETAISWAFIARMGTIIDSSVCDDRRAKQVDSYVSSSYEALFRRAASDPALEQRATRNASAFHQKAIELMVDPEWTCRYWAAIDPQRRSLREGASTPQKQIAERKRALQRVLRKGRIESVEAGDKAKETDPMKKSLMPSGIPQTWIRGNPG